MVLRLDTTHSGFEAAFDDFLTRTREAASEIRADVAAIIIDVRARGDAALLDYTARFDRLAVADASMLRVGAGEISAARNSCDGDALAALEFAHDRIVGFHRRQMPEALEYTDQAGVRLGARWTPIGAVGLYVPGGTAAYPSSVLMNAAPARVAGVERIAMVVPAPDGNLNPLVLAAAAIAGVE